MSEIKLKKRFNNENKNRDNNKIFNSIKINKDKQIFNLNNRNYKIFKNNNTADSPTNIIDQIIKDKIAHNSKSNLFQVNKTFYKNSHNDNKSIHLKKNAMSSSNSRNNFIPSINPFVTSIQFKNIQTNEESKSSSYKFIPKKNNLVSFGQSMNQILINNINDSIIKNGKILPKKRTIISKNLYNENKNYNSYEMHKKIFDDKLIEMLEDYKKRQKINKQMKLYNLMPDLKEKRRINNLKIPLSIKGYNKKVIDIFYTRNICDLDYKKYYTKEKINMNEILHNHNKYNRKDYLSGKVPFFMLTKTVVKPVCMKSKSQKNILGKHLNLISI
jgi:hypothetical protein